MKEEFTTEYAKNIRLRLEDARARGYKYFRWKTSEDEKVCSVCRDYNNQIFNIDRALSNISPLMPLHDNCRCYPIILDKKESLTEMKVINIVGEKGEQQRIEIMDMPDKVYKLFLILKVNYGYRTMEPLKHFIIMNLADKILNPKIFFDFDENGNSKVKDGYYVAKLDLPYKDKDLSEYRFHRTFFDNFEQLESSNSDFYEYRKKGSNDTVLFMKLGQFYFTVNEDKVNELYDYYVKLLERKNKMKEDLTTTNTHVFVTKLGGIANKKKARDIFIKVFEREPESDIDKKVLDIIDKNLNKDSLTESVLDEIRQSLAKYIKNPIILGLIIWYISKQLAK